MFDKFFKKNSGYFYLAFRVVLGLLLFMHGAGKFGLIGEMNIGGFAGMFGFPVWVASLVALVELVGGLAILFGLFTRIAALGNAIVMFGAWFLAHVPKGWNPMSNGGELSLVYFMALLVILAYGAGVWCLEKAILKEEFF
jgi:putative oxidoreductase